MAAIAVERRMIRPRRRALLAAPMLLPAGGARAQQAGAWPSRPVRLIVPFGTGGGTDITTRLLAPRLGEILGQPVIVENRPGGGGIAGTDFVAKSPPNGEVFVLATLSTVALAVGLYQRLPYDPVRDLVGVAPTVFVPIGMAISGRLGPRNAQDFIALLRANPGRYSFGSAGPGTSGHIASSAFLARIGATAEHVVYRGAGQTFLALQQGDVAFTSDIPSLLAPMHREGSAHAIFVATEERSPLLPDVPTAREAGLGDYKAYSWYGIYGPAGTPRPIVERLAAAIDEALGDPAIHRRLEEMGTPGMRGSTPDRFAHYLRTEIDLWVPLVRASGARAD